MKSFNPVELNDFELACIILVMQKVDSEKWHRGRDGLYLDFHDKKVLKKLVKIQEERRISNCKALFNK